MSAQVNRSFSLYWSDAKACGNAIRCAVEELLTAQRVNKSAGKPKPGKHRQMLSLHKRIELFAKAKPDLGDKLLAIKWIGNAGSHVDPLKKDDLLDAYEIMAFVLDELYVQRSVHVGALVRAINRNKGPRKISPPSARN
ncbi:MAG: DUF4145 domain-containing protein [Gemmatimonadaceae bacterium]|nr:DUF4145 domain-containing protein [Gemmatimonadaceae bacterium]